MKRKKNGPTAEEKEQCRDTILRISDKLPMRFTQATQSILEVQGISLDCRYIVDCKNLLRYDIRVVKALETLAVVNEDLRRY